jgi:hypothetical protein
MKLFRLSSMALLLAALFFAGCKAKSAKELIANKWTLTDIGGEGAKDMTDADKKEMVGKVVMELSKDGKCSISGMASSTKTGTYTVSDDGKTLSLIHEGAEKTDPHEINEISASKLVITEMKKDGMKLSFSSK